VEKSKERKNTGRNKLGLKKKRGTGGTKIYMPQKIT
jgi:hypothetical protein